jgi:glycosyltransferase involved in cell wall biosynthesis
MKLVFFGYGILEIGGGFEDYLIDTVTGLASRYPDCEITIVTSSPKLTEKYYKLASAMMFKRFDASSLYREATDSINKRLKNIDYVQFNNLKQFKTILSEADTIYTKNELVEMLLLQLVGTKKLPPIVVGVHSPIVYPYTPTFGARLHNILYNKFVQRRLYQNIAAVKVNNKDDYKYLRSLGIYNVGVLHHAFDVKGITPRYDRSGALHVLFVGRLTEQKGIDILIDVVRKISANNNGEVIKFRIAGSGDPKYLTQIDRLVASHSNVEHLGHVAHDQLKTQYEWADCTLIPSKFETLNKVAVETGIYGKIAISSDIPGPREVIENGETGYLIAVNSEAFYDKIMQVFQMKQTDPAQIIDMGTAARKKIEQEFSSDVVYQSLYEVFKYIRLPKTGQ